MRTLNYFVLVVFISMLTIASQSVAQNKNDLTLEVKVTKLKQDSGMVMLSLISEDKKTVRNLNIPANSETVITKIEGLKAGKYAIRMFHDENNNSVMDNNKMGIPKEGYGFSNNPFSQFGPPSDEKLLFEVLEDAVVEVEMKYYTNCISK